jgi:hypothetical protein
VSIGELSRNSQIEGFADWYETGGTKGASLLVESREGNVMVGSVPIAVSPRPNGRKTTIVNGSISVVAPHERLRSLCLRKALVSVWLRLSPTRGRHATIAIWR